MDTTRKSERIPQLDGLRGIAILMVVASHYGAGVAVAPGSLGSYALVPFLRLGWSGVDLFFVLSGFLICRWLLERGPSAEFYLRRAARTLPLYSLMLALFICGVSAERGELLHLPHLFGNAQYLWSYFALQQNNV